MISKGRRIYKLTRIWARCQFKDTLISFRDIFPECGLSDEMFEKLDSKRKKFKGDVDDRQTLWSHFRGYGIIHQRQTENGIAYIETDNDVLIEYELGTRIMHASVVGLYNMALRLLYEYDRAGLNIMSKAFEAKIDNSKDLSTCVSGNVIAVLSAIGRALRVENATRMIIDPYEDKYMEGDFFFAITQDAQIYNMDTQAIVLAYYMLNVELGSITESVRAVTRFQDQLYVFSFMEPLERTKLPVVELKEMSIEFLINKEPQQEIVDDKESEKEEKFIEVVEANVQKPVVEVVVGYSELGPDIELIYMNYQKRGDEAVESIIKYNKWREYHARLGMSMILEVPTEFYENRQRKKYGEILIQSTHYVVPALITLDNQICGNVSVKMHNHKRKWELFNLTNFYIKIEKQQQDQRLNYDPYLSYKKFKNVKLRGIAESLNLILFVIDKRNGKITYICKTRQPCEKFLVKDTPFRQTLKRKDREFVVETISIKRKKRRKIDIVVDRENVLFPNSL